VASLVIVVSAVGFIVRTNRHTDRHTFTQNHTHTHDAINTLIPLLSAALLDLPHRNATDDPLMGLFRSAAGPLMLLLYVPSVPSVSIRYEILTSLLTH